MIAGLLRVELHLPEASSLKDKRSVIKSIKDRLHGQFNVAVAEVDANEKWQLACLGIATVGGDRHHVEACLQQVRGWLEAHPVIQLVRIEQDIL